jgi:hypothetical protein
MAADKARRVGTVGFQDIAGGSLINEQPCRVSIGKFEDRRSRKAKLRKNPLCITAVVLKPRTVCAAPDDVQSVTSQAVLQRSTSCTHILEKNAAVAAGRANPLKFPFPIGNAIDESGKRVLTQRMSDEDLDLVTILGQAEIKRCEIGAVTDPEEAHVQIPLALRRLAMPLVDSEVLAIAIEATGAVPQPGDGAFTDRLSATRVLLDQ